MVWLGLHPGAHRGLQRMQRIVRLRGVGLHQRGGQRRQRQGIMALGGRSTQTKQLINAGGRRRHAGQAIHLRCAALPWQPEQVGKRIHLARCGRSACSSRCQAQRVRKQGDIGYGSRCAAAGLRGHGGRQAGHQVGEGVVRVQRRGWSSPHRVTPRCPW